MLWSSEAHKVGTLPPENASSEELQAFRNSLDPDMMGFDGNETVEEEE